MKVRRCIAILEKDGHDSHEVAEASSIALAHIVLPTACFSEVRHWRELHRERPPRVPAVVQAFDCRLRFVFPLVACVNVAYKVVSDVVTDVHL